MNKSKANRNLDFLVPKSRQIEIVNEETGLFESISNGLTFSRNCQYEEALKEFNEAIEKDPLYAVPRYYKSFTFQKMGLNEKASLELEEAYSLDPDRIFLKGCIVFFGLESLN